MTGVDRLGEYLRQMRRSAADALSFTEGIDREAFLQDLRTQRAVVMCLMILGEAASRVISNFPEFAEAHPGIPWRAIRGMRNHIANGYFDIDLAVVWQTVQTELSPLLEHLPEAQQ